MKCETGCPYIDDYLNPILSGKQPACRELRQAAEYIPCKLDGPDIFIDTAATGKAIELIERYFGFELIDWEKFVLALIHCFHQEDDTLVFSEFLILMGRGNGKNGFISGLVWYLTTHYHGIDGYNVDIVANSEDQAKVSFQDVYEMLERTWTKSSRFFYRSKEEIRNLKTQSYIRYNTSNARTKDGKRSACLVFDEIHEYEDGASIRVFRSGFGKRKHSRTFYITTNGYVREGVLDSRLELAQSTLNGERPGSRLCPLIYKLDNDQEADEPQNWVKANPSLPYLPNLRLEIEQANIDRQDDNEVALDFFTKRMNLPRTNLEIAVTSYENLLATNRGVPDLEGWSCVVGIDFASLRDWAAVNFHFVRGQERFDINHAWICLQSPELFRIKAPWKDWAKQGLLTPVDEVEIPPESLAEYIIEKAMRYNIVGLALDNFRFALMKRALREAGFDLETGNLKLVRPSDIYKIQPVIESCFQTQRFTWGNNPMLRWAVNNTKLVRSGKKEGTDTGNFYYAKIEGKSRKTDPFMSLVASMTLEERLSLVDYGELPELGSIVC